MRTEPPKISGTALESLNEAAIAIQAQLLDRIGEWYELHALNEVLAKWLELSIEQLCDDAAEHCITGDRTYAFNRHDFDRLLTSVPSVNLQRVQVLQEEKDYATLAVRQVA